MIKKIQFGIEPLFFVCYSDSSILPVTSFLAYPQRQNGIITDYVDFTDVSGKHLSADYADEIWKAGLLFRTLVWVGIIYFDEKNEVRSKN